MNIVVLSGGGVIGSQTVARLGGRAMMSCRLGADQASKP
jgi:hypothetical protein